MWNIGDLNSHQSNPLKRNFHTAVPSSVPSVVFSMSTNLMTINPMKRFQNPNFINSPINIAPTKVQNYQNFCVTSIPENNSHKNSLCTNIKINMKNTNNPNGQKQTQPPEVRVGSNRDNPTCKSASNKSRRRRRNRRKNKDNKNKMDKNSQPPLPPSPPTSPPPPPSPPAETTSTITTPTSAPGCLSLKSELCPLLCDIDRNESNNRERLMSTTSEDSFIVFFDEDAVDEDVVDEGLCTSSLPSSSPESEDEAEESETSTVEVVPRKKVHFAVGDDLCEIHPMIQWSYAYQQARKGPWEEYARDRERFRMRIYRTGQTLEYILTPNHRQKVYEERFENSIVNNNENDKNDTKK